LSAHGIPAFDPIWDEALTRMKSRIDATMSASLAGFPHYADPATGQWVTTTDGFWTGGFWIRELWLAGHYWRDPPYARAAEDWLRKLAPRIDSKSVFRGFLFYYGAVAGAQLANNAYARAIAVRSAEALATTFNPIVGLLPLGTEAEEAQKVGDDESNIDGLIASPLLLWTAKATGDANLRRIALALANRNAAFCVQVDGSVIQSASFDPVTGRVTRRYTHKGSSPSAIWTRAQAWAMLGYALCAVLAPEERRFVVLADRVAQWWIDHVPTDRVAYWDFSVPKTTDTRKDTSGTAIAAAALLKLSAVHPDRKAASRYAEFAHDTVRALLEHHLTPTGPSDRRPAGILADGCFDPNNGVAVANELIWGDYFLFEAHGVLSGRLAATVI
jgi:unsaturated chondroitin disaccharide hydrolase